MANFDMQPTGFSLLSGSQSFLTDLSEDNESIIVGGTGYKQKNSSDSKESSKKYSQKESS